MLIHGQVVFGFEIVMALVRKIHRPSRLYCREKTLWAWSCIPESSWRGAGEFEFASTVGWRKFGALFSGERPCVALARQSHRFETIEEAEGKPAALRLFLLKGGFSSPLK